MRHAAHIRDLTFPDPSPPLSLRTLNLPNLVALDLGGLEQFAVADAHVEQVLSCCSRLIRLALPDCVCCTDATLFALAAFTNISGFQLLNLDRCCEMSDAGLVPLIKRLNNISSLSLNLLPLATTAVTHAIASTCHKLQLLNMADCDAITDESLIWLASGCPLLNSIDLSDCAHVSESGLIEFVNQRKHSAPSPKFYSLKLNGLDAVTDKSLLALTTGEPESPVEDATALKSKNTIKIPLSVLEASNLGNMSHSALEALSCCLLSNRLTTLNLSRLNIPQQDAESIQALSATLSSFFRTQKSLKTLLLTGGLTGAIEDTVCQSISANCLQLDTLDMSECALITDVGTKVIASSCRALTNVNWKGCMGVTDTTISSFFYNATTNEPHSTPSSLRFLNVGLCSKISDASTFHLTRLVQGDSKGTSTRGLHTLKFSGCFNVSDASLHSISSAILSSSSTPNSSTSSSSSAQPPPTGSLRLLCFSGCYKITSPALTTLTTLLPFLESINLYSCPNISNTAIASIAATCPRLLSLVISKCPVGDVAALAIAERCKRLHTLYMSFLTSCVDDDGSGGFGVKSYLTDVGVGAIVRGCRGLKLLDLSRCDKVTDAAFSVKQQQQLGEFGFGNDCQQQQLGLQVLIVRACPNLTLDGMVSFVKQCPRLLTLDVLGCAKFGVREREMLREVVERVV
ncbi:UNVERIFIED_CONTAM: hypothetical protein HDU68_000730 [Siphonaria sp. JEL0065]|nr:hypothetical protein HDU68_000730 [Siphonaria sp. JEL0065]